MRNLAAALALALLLSAAPARADDVAFTHVTVVDVVEGRLIRDQVVRISGERIVEVVPEAGARIPKALADLVLIDGDPLADIRNTRRISAVVSNGRYLDRPALDALLANAERLARSGKHDLIHPPGRANGDKK
jgi:imidazolonepropionase-like amidohydrolase